MPSKLVRLLSSNTPIFGVGFGRYFSSPVVVAGLALMLELSAPVPQPTNAIDNVAINKAIALVLLTVFFIVKSSKLNFIRTFVYR
jgi:hypothetical protein